MSKYYDHKIAVFEYPQDDNLRVCKHTNIYSWYQHIGELIETVRRLEDSVGKPFVLVKMQLVGSIVDLEQLGLSYTIELNEEGVSRQIN